MKHLKKIIALLLAVLLVLQVTACAKKTDSKVETTAGETFAEAETTAPAAENTESDKTEEVAEESDNELIILYTNDTHGYMDNFTKETDGKRGLSFASVAAMKKELINQGEKVVLVDAGDHIQGTVYSAVDEGRQINYLMNVAGYDLATLGNHEFDYNSYRALTVSAKAWFPYVSCNMYEISDGLPLFPAYETFETKSGKTVAIIGMGTPESVTVPARFQDDKGNYYLDFYGRQDPNDLYMAVQYAIDLAKFEGADYIIGLGHLGVDTASTGVRSIDVISHVTGFDAFIDGHSHTVMEKKMVADASGKEIPLTQTGCYFNSIGKLTLKKDGSIDTELISDYEKYDTFVRSMELSWIRAVDLQLGDEVANSEVNFCLYDPDNPDLRLVRNTESNLGDLCADAIYNCFNNNKGIDCDLAIVNGGGIRDGIKTGVISYKTCKSVHPFGNMVCIVKASGQQILDMLEWTSRSAGLIDPETGKEAEEGGFLQCAGIKYTIDTTIPDTMPRGENGSWGGAPSGDYRVRDVQVYNKTTNQYEPLDLEKKYSLAGQNYLLRSMGGGMNMLKDVELIEDYVGEDYMILSEYLHGFATDESGQVVVNTENSPLRKFEGYEINYEDKYGAGRISKIVQ